MIKIENLSKSFGTHEVLKNIDLKIETQEFVVMIGPSGCGKTTLLNMIAGYDFPTSGTIHMQEQLIKQPAQERAVISQENALFPWYSVYDNIAYGMRLKKMDEAVIKEKTHKILKEIQLLDSIDKKVFELSGGMKQRVALAQILVNEPELILLDEPLGALDTITRKTMQSLIHKLWLEKKLTMFMITHDIDEALLLATRIVVMSETGMKEFRPTFYKAQNYDKVYLEAEYNQMKQLIMELV